MNKSVNTIAAVIALVGVGGIVTVYGRNPAPHAIEWGWYVRADSRASGYGITGFNMSVGETGVRCLCGERGFAGYDVGGDFVVTKAPEGYDDTIGRRFHAKQVNCLTCAD